MADNPNRDQEAARMARENERRHQDAIDAMARKNEDVQREAQKARQASEQRKIEMSRQNEY
jgi:hypothetical protein